MRIRLKKKHQIIRVVAGLFGVAIIALVGVSLLRTPSVRADAINNTDFVITVDTTKTGSSTNTQFTIPTNGTGYSYTVDCNNDGVVDATGQTGNYTCNYASEGVYTVRIGGTFPTIYFNNAGDRLKLMSIDQWGTGNWYSMANSFYGTENMDLKATDTPIFPSGQYISLYRMFASARSLQGASANWNWDMTNVRSTSWMFSGAEVFNQPLNQWNMSNIESTNGMFEGTRAFNQPLNNWVMSKVTTIDNMFSNTYAFNQDISSWDVSGVMNMSNAFYYARAFNQPLNQWNVAKVTNMANIFHRASLFNQPLDRWNTAKVISMENAFRNASAFNQSLATWDMTSVAVAANMLSDSNLSLQNYDATLIAWDAQNLNSGVTLGSQNLTYCLADTARNNMMTSDSWTISGDSKNCSAYPVTAVSLSGGLAVDENVTIGTQLGALSAASNVPNDTFAYSLTCTTPGAQDNFVQLSGATVELTRSPDYEQQQTLTICVRATSSITGQVRDQVFTITVNNLLTLSYGANNATSGSVPAASETYRANQSVSLAANSGNLARTGYTFVGWNTLANGNGTSYATGAPFIMPGVDTVLYAQWRDATPPTTPSAAPDLTSLTDSGDSDTDNITNATKPNFTVTCSEVGSTIALYANGAAVGTVECVALGQATVSPTNALADNTYAITYTEKDTLNNESGQSPSLTVTIDTVPPVQPTISINAIATDNTVNADEATQTQNISGTVNGGRAGDQVTVTVNGVPRTVSLLANGQFHVAVPGSDLASDPNKTVTASVRSFDVAGNSVTATNTRSYLVDTSTVPAPARPTLDPASDSGISNSDNITNNTTPTIEVYCSAATDTIQLTYSGRTQSLACTGAGAMRVAIGVLNQGDHDVSYRIVNAAGNTSASSATLTITVDVVAPTVTLTTGKTSDTTPALSGTVNDPRAAVTVTIGGTTYTARNNGDGTWSLPDNVISPALGEGDHSITITATDIAGNTSSTPNTLKLPISIDPPALTKLAKVKDLATNRVEWTITATNNNNAAQTITITDALPQRSTFVSGSITCTVTSSDSQIGRCDFDQSIDPTSLNVQALLASGETITVVVISTTAIGEPNVTNNASAQFAGDTGVNASQTATASTGLNAAQSASDPVKAVAAALAETGISLYAWIAGGVLAIAAAVGLVVVARRRSRS